MIYLDNAATTKMSPAALAAYTAAATDLFGNPSSRHLVGVAAARRLSDSRRELLSLFPKDGTVLFTGSGSEADNLAVLGRAYAKARYKNGKILTTAGEHAAVRSACEKLRAEGFRVAEIPTKGGVLDLAVAEREMTPDVFLVSAMAVNNETGAIYDLAALQRIMKGKAPDAVLHVDATQALFKIPLPFADLITVSAHKVHGPKGIGALYVSSALLRQKGISPIVYGGGQEEGLRSGTVDVPAAAAFAAAVREGKEKMQDAVLRMTEVKEALLEGLCGNPVLSSVVPLLPPASAPHILTLLLPGVKSEVALNFLSRRGIAVSSGSACSSHARSLSSALLAYGLTERETDCAIRISLSGESTVKEAEEFLAALADAVSSLARMR